MIPNYWGPFPTIPEYGQYFPPVYAPEPEAFYSNYGHYGFVSPAQPFKPVNSIEKSSKIFITKEDLEGQTYISCKKTWNEEQDIRLCNLIEKDGLGWKQVRENMPDRTYKMCYSRYRRIKQTKKQAWTPAEDSKIKELVLTIGKSWKRISSYIPKRTPKQIRERYINFIRPDISQDEWTVEEDLKLVDLINQLGRKWKKIEEALVVRTQNQIKNRYFNRILKLWNKKNEKNEQHPSRHEIH